MLCMLYCDILHIVFIYLYIVVREMPCMGDAFNPKITDVYGGRNIIKCAFFLMGQ